MQRPPARPCRPGRSGRAARPNHVTAARRSRGDCAPSSTSASTSRRNARLRRWVCATSSAARRRGVVPPSRTTSERTATAASSERAAEASISAAGSTREHRAGVQQEPRPLALPSRRLTGVVHVDPAMEGRPLASSYPPSHVDAGDPQGRRLRAGDDTGLSAERSVELVHATTVARSSCRRQASTRGCGESGGSGGRGVDLARAASSTWVTPPEPQAAAVTTTRARSSGRVQRVWARARRKPDQQRNGTATNTAAAGSSRRARAEKTSPVTVVATASRLE